MSTLFQFWLFPQKPSQVLMVRVLTVRVVGTLTYNMQILFTTLAHVSKNAHVHHRLLSLQSASLAAANEPPHIMW